MGWNMKKIAKQDAPFLVLPNVKSNLFKFMSLKKRKGIGRMRRSKGKYSKQGRNLKSKGRVAITRQLEVFAPGEKVIIDVNPRFREGMPFLRFNHKNATILNRQGKCSVVRFKDMAKEKTAIIANIHLRRV